MNKILDIGVLAFHGDVREHYEALFRAAESLKIKVRVREVRTQSDLKRLSGLVIPGGESPTLQKLCERAGLWRPMKNIKNIFGTCAGAVLLSKNIGNASPGQKSLSLMHITIARNAYGRQADSFEKIIATSFGKINAVFIRAPKITNLGAKVKVLAQSDEEVLACEERIGNKFYLAACFHPELTSTKFHEYFLKECLTR